MIALGILIIVAGLLARLTIRVIGLRRAQPYLRWNTGLWEATYKLYRHRSTMVATACFILGSILLITAKLPF